jgi:hypothetical protein
MTPVQVDGEPWEQHPADLNITFHNQATVLRCTEEAEWTAAMLPTFHIRLSAVMCYGCNFVTLSSYVLILCTFIGCYFTVSFTCLGTLLMLLMFCDNVGQIYFFSVYVFIVSLNVTCYNITLSWNYKFKLNVLEWEMNLIVLFWCEFTPFTAFQYQRKAQNRIFIVMAGGCKTHWTGNGVVDKHHSVKFSIRCISIQILMSHTDTFMWVMNRSV